MREPTCPAELCVSHTLPPLGRSRTSPCRDKAGFDAWRGPLTLPGLHNLYVVEPAFKSVSA